VFKGLDIEEIIPSTILLGILWLFRRDFSVKSDPTAFERLLTSLPAILALFWVYALVGFYLLRQELSPSFNLSWAIEETLNLVTFQGPKIYIPLTFRASFFENSLLSVAGLVSMNMVYNVMRPYIIREPSIGDKELARTILRENGVTTNSYFTMGTDKTYFFNEKGTGYIAYVVKHGVAITAGDPVCKLDDVKDLVSDYLELCDENGWTPVFNYVEERYMDVYLKHGLKKVKTAEEGVVGLQSWDLKGKSKEDIRGSHNKGVKSNWAFRMYNEEIRDSELVKSITEISEQWLSDKFGGEMSFMMGVTPMFGSDETLVTTVEDSQGKLMAFMTWAPIYGQNGWTGDYIRRLKESPNGVIDFMLVSSLLELKNKGYNIVSMGGAPLHGVGGENQDAIKILDRGMHFIYEHVDEVYHYKQLYEFKEKYGPRWENRYIVYENILDLPRVIIALVNAHMPNLKLKDVLKALIEQ
jgi:phosphatidylglycerol lysyltransferase